MMSIDNAIAIAATGSLPKLLFFWGGEPRHDGSIRGECLSQWYPAEFDVDGVRYRSAEHYMMAEKARLFGDSKRCSAILTASSPGAAKALGREVAGFDETRWKQERTRIVVAGNLAKFGQNQPLASYLQGTEPRILVEASPLDKIWGIGLAADDARAREPATWRGLNLLGFALMDVRQQLSAMSDARA